MYRNRLLATLHKLKITHAPFHSPQPAKHILFFTLQILIAIYGSLIGLVMDERKVYFSRLQELQDNLL